MSQRYDYFETAAASFVIQEYEMSTTMTPLITLQHKRDELLSDATQWSQTHLNYRVRQDTWCALEVLNHLARTERNAAEQMKENRKTRTKERARVTPSQLVLFTIMKSPLRVKVPSGAEFLYPITPASLSQAVDDWKQAGFELEQALSGIAHDESTLGVFQHPIGGWMNAHATVRFLRLHLEHHRHQWNRLAGALA